MSGLQKKGMLIFGFLTVLSLLLFVDTDWEVSHRIAISAKPAVVWEVLTDLESYSEWNRYSPVVKGRLAVGEVVWVEAHLDDEIQHVQNFVLSKKPPLELCWQSAGWYAALARGTRCRWLKEDRKGNTLLVHHEEMSGPLAWLIEWRYRDRIERGLKLVDESVAQRAEFLAKKRVKTLVEAMAPPP